MSFRDSLRLQSELPIFQMNDDDPEGLDIQRWQNCVGYAEDISSVFEHWDESYYEVVNLITSYLMWYARTVLLIQAMSIPLELPTSDPVTRRLEAAVDVIYESLRRFAMWWPVAYKLTGMRSRRSPRSALTAVLRIHRRASTLDVA